MSTDSSFTSFAIYTNHVNVLSVFNLDVELTWVIHVRLYNLRL